MNAHHTQATSDYPSEDGTTENFGLWEELQKKQGENQQLIHQLAQERSENASLRSSLIRCTSMLQANDMQLQKKDRQLQELLQEKDKQLIEKDRLLQKMVTQLQETVKDQQNTIRQLQDKDEILRKKDEELHRKERQLQEALRQLQQKERQKKEWWQHIGCNVLKDKALASGAWGVVYKGMLPVAIKEPKSTTTQGLNLFRREREAALFCHHPNIVQFLGAITLHNLHPNIVMELMEGNLRDFIKHQNYRMQQKDIVSIALDVAKGLSYLHHEHNPPILHRDLKTDNILLKRGTAKIGDLGSAEFQHDNMTWYCGTLIYTAPEALNRNIQTPKMDVFSYGLVVQEMATGERPVPNNLPEQVQRVICPKLKELVTACTKIEPDQRPFMSQVVKFLDENFTYTYRQQSTQ